MKATEKPNREQLNALRKYAQRHGRNWKQSLRDVWFNGRYDWDGDGDISCYLQQVRNQLGPSWLTNFKLEAE